MSKTAKTGKPVFCSCGRGFDCSRCGRHVYCDPDANFHSLKICRRCCVAEGIKAICAQQAATTTAALTAPRELAIRQAPRVGMTERGLTESILMDAWASGRLTDDVYDARMAAAAKADNQEALDILTVDIAPPKPPVPARPLPPGDRVLNYVTRIPNAWLLLLFLLLLAISITSGGHH